MPYTHILSAVVALLPAVSFWWIISMRWDLNATAFMSVIERLLTADNENRAIKLCSAGGMSLLSRSLRPILVRAQEPDGRSLYALASVARRQLEDAETGLSRWMWAGAAGALLTVLSALIGMTAPDGLNLGWAINAVSILLLAGGARSFFRIRNSVRQMPATVIPLLLQKDGDPPSATEVVHAVLNA